jgi:hypothetical protein
MTEKKSTAKKSGTKKAAAKKAPAKKATPKQEESSVVVQTVSIGLTQMTIKCPFCHSIHFHPVEELNTTTLSRCDNDAKSYFIKEHAR